MTHISKSEFEALNLPVKQIQSIHKFNCFLKYFTKQCPNYLNEVFKLACPNKSRTKNAYLKLICPFHKTNSRQNAISFIGPSIWNKTPEVFKRKKTALIIPNIT